MSGQTGLVAEQSPTSGASQFIGGTTVLLSVMACKIFIAGEPFPTFATTEFFFAHVNQCYVCFKIVLATKSSVAVKTNRISWRIVGMKVFRV